MRVPVLLFASYADAFGCDRLEVDVAEGARVRDLVAAVRRLPGGERLPPEPLVALDRRYAAYDAPIVPGSEVAVIPPVAGG